MSIIKYLLTFTGSNAIRLLGAVSVCTLVLLSTTAASARSEAPEENEWAATTIEGSWLFQITRTDGTTFTALQAYTAGGVALGTGSIQTPPTSALFGTWKRTGHNHFVHTFYLFIFGYNGGDAENMLKNNIQLHLNQQGELVGTGSGVFCDVKGNNCLPFEGISLVGTRIPAE
jgi:hypothetical protein